jgi:hypothetical protein
VLTQQIAEFGYTLPRDWRRYLLKFVRYCFSIPGLLSFLLIVAFAAPRSGANHISSTFAESSNPIDDSHTFVRQHYLDFLNREPDAAGWEFWIGKIESCGQDVQCREVKRIDTSAAYFLSIEFQHTGYLVPVHHSIHQRGFAAAQCGKALPFRTRFFL